MRRTTHFAYMLTGICTLSLALAGKAVAEDKSPAPIDLGSNGLQLTPPENWIAKKPKFAGIVQHEYAVKAADGDKSGGRVTMGGAGGGLDSNKRRWLGQFSQADGSSSEDKLQEEKKEIAGCTVHLLDISGTYKAPPFEPGGGWPARKLSHAGGDYRWR